MPERRTALYDFHYRSARNLIKGGGDFMFPSSYTSPVEEHLNVRRNVGMQDLSTKTAASWTTSLSTSSATSTS